MDDKLWKKISQQESLNHQVYASSDFAHGIERGRLLGKLEGRLLGMAEERERIISIIEVDVQIHHERGLDASAEYLINLIARIKGEK